MWEFLETLMGDRRDLEGKVESFARTLERACAGDGFVIPIFYFFALFPYPSLGT